MEDENLFNFGGQVSFFDAFHAEVFNKLRKNALIAFVSTLSSVFR